MKKFLGIVLILALVMSLGVAAFADVTISVSQDSTYAGAEGGAGRNYAWYKVFSANPESGFTGTTGGGYDSDGTPGTVTGDTEHAISYTASAAVAAKLGTWVAAAAEDDPATTDVDESKAHWVRVTGNNWFDLAPIAGSTNYTVTWATGVATDADTVQTAAKWLLNNKVYDDTGILAWNSTDKKWAATVDEGYYLIASVLLNEAGTAVTELGAGANLVAATTDINIQEKNSYPPLDKTEADEDDTTPSDTTRDVAIGDVLTYNVKVTIPATAKVGDLIQVYDAASEGLTYDSSSMTVTIDGTAVTPAAGAVVAPVTLETGDEWRYNITVNADNIGKVVLFAFTMTVNSEALVDTGKVNESGLKYGTSDGFTYESIPDEVEYKTYFAGIHKVDGADKTKDLEGVEFTLKEAGTAFYVKKDGDYYIPCASTDTGATTTVVTDSQGRIMIRGLDEDKTYTLTETKTLDGYNMLTEDVTLSLYEDTITKTTSEGTTTTTTSFDSTKTNEKWGEVENNKGTILPSTGGIGTTIFYVIGGILVVGAGIVLVARKKSRDD